MPKGKRRFGHKRKPQRKDNKLAAKKKQSSKRVEASEQGTKLKVFRIRNRETVETGNRSGRERIGNLLTDPRQERTDVKLVERAVRNGWGVKRKNTIRNRLVGILQKTVGDVVTKHGILRSETKADELAVAAARVLVAMNGQDQRDDHHAKEMENPIPAGGTTTVNINVNDRTAAIARLASALGARELIIEGRAVTPADLAGSAVPVHEAEATAGQAADPVESEAD